MHSRDTRNVNNTPTIGWK